MLNLVAQSKNKKVSYSCCDFWNVDHFPEHLVFPHLETSSKNLIYTRKKEMRYEKISQTL